LHSRRPAHDDSRVWCAPASPVAARELLQLATLSATERHPPLPLELRLPAFARALGAHSYADA
jgi:hypothetical protein